MFFNELSVKGPNIKNGLKNAIEYGSKISTDFMHWLEHESTKTNIFKSFANKIAQKDIKITYNSL